MSEYAAEADLEEQATDVEVEAVDDEAPLDTEERLDPMPDDVDEADFVEQTLDATGADDYDR
ncbi:hypothetical protein FB381_1301 [Nocardioides albertanoniae]|uniref:Uncharacterized protein n=1 Tax=Nocardioides albertanoniae TaxID=1175486 RepID=A0A543A4A5_9ACTN|nr:hypothetical protein [Nocardioides albertanoniae]TQL67425.1 hypothetical protein FB381_1301 [Nocardioides albertanoniae]